MSLLPSISNYSTHKKELSPDEIETIIQSFAKVIRSQQNLNDLVWSLVDHVNLELNYEDCVIYLYDDKKMSLIQRAAFGAKKVNAQNIKNPIRIEPGEGIVGRVFQSGIPRIIADTSRDANYIIDDRFRLSEIAIPIFKKGKVIGVIDSEHPSEDYYTKTDQQILTQIATFIVDQMDNF